MTTQQLGYALTAAFALAASDARADSARSEIQHDYQSFAAAESSRQYPRIKQVADTVFSPTFIVKTGKNTLPYNKFLQEMKAMTLETRTVQQNTFRTIPLRRQGGSMQENGVYVFNRTALDPNGDFGAKGLTHQVNFQAHYQSVWVKMGGKLRLQSLQFVDRQEVVDGKRQR